MSTGTAWLARLGTLCYLYGVMAFPGPLASHFRLENSTVGMLALFLFAMLNVIITANVDPVPLRPNAIFAARMGALACLFAVLAFHRELSALLRLEKGLFGVAVLVIFSLFQRGLTSSEKRPAVCT